MIRDPFTSKATHELLVFATTTSILYSNWMNNLQQCITKEIFTIWTPHGGVEGKCYRDLDVLNKNQALVNVVKKEKKNVKLPCLAKPRKQVN